MIKINIKILLLLSSLSTQVSATQNQIDTFNEQLLIAAESEDFEDSYNQAKTALEKGADINTKDKYKMTPLHWACAIGRFPNIVKLFIEHDADLNSLDISNLTPLHNACRKRNQTMINLLVLAGAKIPHDLQNNSFIQQAKILLNQMLAQEKKRRCNG